MPMVPNHRAKVRQARDVKQALAGGNLSLILTFNPSFISSLALILLALGIYVMSHVLKKKLILSFLYFSLSIFYFFYLTPYDL